jgi:threonylcarbamoyladenosine tRNA methylthiotransferase MtaB
MPQVEPEVVRARAKRLRNVCTARRQRWLDTLIGSDQTMLIELDGRSGHAESFGKVELADALAPNTLQSVRITARHGDTLIGQPR